ncbi:hypothetical protein CEUSTIGMA_g13388.t1 [Chlamydomonas eustigma]|uniref:Uncharacterized protein n=1 Tax=Chlamydomonas eustigma TaxID=1157962 RepID=A0A250XSR9_9CHLO|nr:hypothetical protein CEUSTIGMA_g13388.t1 [Chlamydomonas eustigma]|eukprot:GAX85972.1 hypothetical protein CEUSTIGMA_g13388.t1 [Chlamydomonas eustigma]
MDADDVKHLHVIVQDKGKPIEVHGLLIPNNTSLQELQERVEETILGPAEHRWEIISEERLDDINPLTGGGTIQVTSLLKSRVLKLFTHPHAACAPVIGVEPHELPPSVDLYRLMMRHSFPVPSPLLQELDIQRWWSQVPVSRVDLRAQLMKRLVEKMTVGQPAASRTQSMSRASRQGSSGSIQSFRSVSSSGGMGKTANRRSSRQLVDVIPEEGEEELGLVELLVEVLEQQVAWRTSCTEALVSQVLEVQAWQQRELGRRAMKTMTSNLTPSKKDSPPEETDVSNTVTREGPAISGGPQGDSTAADPGLVGEEAPPSAELLPVLQMRNHVVFHALGALAVLAVDADARLRWIKMSPGLDMLVRLCSLEFPVPPAPLPDLPTSPTDADPLAEELSDDQPLLDTIAATATEESLAAAHTLPNPTSAAAPLPLSSPTASTATTQNTRHKSTSSSRPQSAAMVSSSDGAGVLSEETPLNPKESLPKALSWREDMDEEEPPPNEDLPETQQKMAAEVMYSMLGRDRNVRQAFVFAGGVAKVLHLLESRNADVRYCSVLAVAAYSLDMDRDHVTGLSMLRSSDLTEQLIEALLPVAEEVVVMLHGYSSGLAPQLQSASSGPGHQDQDHGFNEFKTAVAAGDGIEDATSIGSGVHPLLSLLEGAGAAIRGCVVAHITGAGISPPSMLSLWNVSRLARLAELLGHQLQELLKQGMSSEEDESWPPLKSQKPSPATRLNPSSSSDSPQLDAREGQQAKSPSYTTVSNELAKPVILVDLQNVILPQIRTLYCLMSCLVTVQTGPGFLSTSLQRLQSLLSLISEQEADLEDKLEVLRQEHINAAKRRTASSISFHFEDSTSEEAGPEAAVEEAERTLAASQAELVDLKEDLQAASEDCIIAALESMGLPILKHPSWVSELGDQLGHVQLMALGLALAMVEARHPHEHTTGGQKPDTLFQGPFRQLLLDSQVIQAVIKVASSPSLDACEPKLGRDTRMVASAALGHLFAVQVPLPAEQDIKAVLQYMVKVHQHHDCSPHLASALWCLARHELNRRVILTSHEWINLCTYWSDCCLEDLKRASSPSEVHRHSAAATAAASAPSSIPMLRCCMMTTWMLLKQWLLDHASHVSAMQASGAASTDAVYLRSETSWWAVKFDVSVPLRGPPLDQPGSVAGGGLGMLLHLAAQAAERGMPRNLPLWDMALRCCWSLATSHPSVSSHLIKLGVDRLLVHYCTSQRAASPLVCVAVKYLTFLMTSSSGLEALGGPARVCKILVVVLDRAMAGSDDAGRGADVPLLELAVRGLASAALLGPVGRQAVLDARGVRRLIEVVRADNRALEQVMSAR